MEHCSHERSKVTNGSILNAVGQPCTDEMQIFKSPCSKNTTSLSSFTINTGLVSWQHVYL